MCIDPASKLLHIELEVHLHVVLTCPAKTNISELVQLVLGAALKGFMGLQVFLYFQESLLIHALCVSLCRQSNCLQTSVCNARVRTTSGRCITWTTRYASTDPDDKSVLSLSNGVTQELRICQHLSQDEGYCGGLHLCK